MATTLHLNALTVNDNIGESLTWLQEFLGVNKITVTPSNKAAFDSASLVEKVNYLYKQNEELKSSISSMQSSGSTASVIKSIQRGTVYLSGKTSTGYAKLSSTNVTINPVDMQKSIILAASTGYTCEAGGDTVGDFVNSTTIKVSVWTYDTTAVVWQVIEFY